MLDDLYYEVVPEAGAERRDLRHAPQERDDIDAQLAGDVQAGLSNNPKALPSRWLYEGVGSELFERITHLDEYYPTRAERAILAEHASSVAVLSGATTVVELGSGASDKTTLLLDAFEQVGQLAAFVAVDVAEPVLRNSVAQLSHRYPRAAVTGLVADFGEDLLSMIQGSERLVAFLGGTIGNLAPTERRALLCHLAEFLDEDEHLLIGTDLVKDPCRLLAAYDDPGGVTAAFEKNVLRLVNSRLGANFDLDRFSYVVRWDPGAELIEMGLRSEGEQDVTVEALDFSVHFDDNEVLLTEISTKFTLSGIAEEISAVGFATVEQWLDPVGDYALTLVRRVASRRGHDAHFGLAGRRDEDIDPKPTLEGYRGVRAFTEWLARPLSAEDQTVQSMPDVSPTKWHRAHATWFFEQFVLAPSSIGYRPMDERFGYLFNSYYEGAGPRHARDRRGLLSRPGVGEIAAYRQTVDEAMERLLCSGVSPSVAALVELGLHHEQQHQELLLMDIKHVLSLNPLAPAYRPDPMAGTSCAMGESEGWGERGCGWIGHPGGLIEVGHHAPVDSMGGIDFSGGFVFDNESPRHKVWLNAFALADRLVTAGEWLAFMNDGGYQRPNLWLSDGWAINLADDRRAPLYWHEGANGWEVHTLAGRQPLDPSIPVVHVSYYEADAFARWAEARLPTEAEWEAVAEGSAGADHAEIRLHPRRATAPLAPDHVRQLYSEAWQWTNSAYLPYPGFQALGGVVGEYNGKFMVGQHVLRGSACVTPPVHSRVTYRNFFPPAARWAFSGVRLAKDA
jgi:dimethylhistidine N-methyltransferase